MYRYRDKAEEMKALGLFKCADAHYAYTVNALILLE